MNLNELDAQMQELACRRCRRSKLQADEMMALRQLEEVRGRVERWRRATVLGGDPDTGLAPFLADLFADESRWRPSGANADLARRRLRRDEAIEAVPQLERELSSLRDELALLDDTAAREHEVARRRQLLVDPGDVRAGDRIVAHAEERAAIAQQQQDVAAALRHVDDVLTELHGANAAFDQVPHWGDGVGVDEIEPARHHLHAAMRRTRLLQRDVRDNLLLIDPDRARTIAAAEALENVWNGVLGDWFAQGGLESAAEAVNCWIYALHDLTRDLQRQADEVGRALAELERVQGWRIADRL